MCLLAFNRKFEDVRSAFLQMKGLSPQSIPVDLMDSFKRFATNIDGNYVYRHSVTVRPQARDNKSRIVAWGTYWPCSIFGFVLRNPVKAVLTFLFDMFSNSYQWISDRIINHEEFEERPELSKDDKDD